MPRQLSCFILAATASLMLVSCTGFRHLSKEERIIRHRETELRQKKELWYQSQSRRDVAIADATTRGHGQSTQVAYWNQHNATADSELEKIERELALLQQGVVTEEARKSWRRR